MSIQRPRRGLVFLSAFLFLFLIIPAVPAVATPVCTDGYHGGPPRIRCGNRVFPEAALATGYVQYTPDPSEFSEYQHGIEYLAQLYPRWISVFTLNEYFRDKKAVSAGDDRVRSYEKGDTGDGRQIWIIKITDHKVPDKGKMKLAYSLSVHGNERGGLEGGLRTAEDLAMAAESGGTIIDGMPNYESTTGRKPKFHEYEVADVLKKQVVYLTAFNIDGWAVGDYWHQPTPTIYSRGNSLGTDLNRQMPTVGWINATRNPLQESEMKYGHAWMHDMAASAPGKLLAHGADIHGQINSDAYVDIMYPAGQFDSIDHRRLMAIAERVKSVIDETLYAGIIDEAENSSYGNNGDAPGGTNPDARRTIPTRPARWSTVWDALGYTDTGFIGDYIATDLAVTGMDYELSFNHTVPDKVWNVYMQENHINGTRAMIKTSMAYAMYQKKDFSPKTVRVDTKGTAGYVFNPDPVTHNDKNGVGTKPGPAANGRGADGKPIKQRPYSATPMQWFKDTSKLMPEPFVPVLPGDIAASPKYLDRLDTLVIADVPLPRDAKGRKVDAKKYYANIKAWVKRGGNLVLTDKALHALGSLGLVPKTAVRDIKVYQPWTTIRDFEHSLTKGLRVTARQLAEYTLIGYCIGTGCSPMTVVDAQAWTGAGGAVVGTTGTPDGATDDASQVSIGELPLGSGRVRVVGGVLATPTEEFDHRYGLRDYAMTYTGLFIMENSLTNDSPKLGSDRALLDWVRF
ncbi:MAG TPA: M14 family zinc carboxypeptidase [Actinomycetota bacterium]|nr:M14 family zinc carboxypeptidase [Actinomycetota bacterium]